MKLTTPTTVELVVLIREGKYESIATFGQFIKMSETNVWWEDTVLMEVPYEDWFDEKLNMETIGYYIRNYSKTK